MDQAGNQLLPIAGPHLPSALATAITPWPIGPNRGSCGTAAFTKQRVVTPDISDDPRWPDDARGMAIAHGVCAAWSEPLISKDGEVLGTFCIFHFQNSLESPGLVYIIGHTATLPPLFEFATFFRNCWGTRMCLLRSIVTSLAAAASGSTARPICCENRLACGFT